MKTRRSSDDMDRSLASRSESPRPNPASQTLNPKRLRDHSPVRPWAATLLVALFWLAPPNLAQAQDEPEFTSDFPLGECTFKAKGVNPFFSLNPGYQLILQGEAADGEDVETVRLVITVLNEIEEIELPELGVVKTRVVQEHETVDGETVEISRNFYAICQETNDVYYFGEEVDIFNEDGSVTHEGAWRAGVDGAVPGIIMPGTFLLGARYFQEVAPDVALDRAEHVEAGLELDTAAGAFQDCARVVETTPLEAGESEKIYCPAVGLVMDGILQLVEIIDDGANDERLYFAQFGNGGGLVSEIILTNRSSAETASGQLAFRGSDGLPLAVGTSLGGDPIDHLEFEIEPGGAFRLATDGQGDDPLAGSAVVTSPEPLGGVIRFSINGLGIAGVGGGPSLCKATAPVRQAGGIRTGLAIRNTNLDAAVTINLSLRDDEGVEVANGNRQLMLPPGGHTAAFVDEIFDGADLEGFLGVVLLQSDDDVAVIALELGSTPGQFTTLPVSQAK